MEQSEQVEVMYEIQAILRKRVEADTNRALYLIKWKGWKEKTWEPIEHLYNVPQMIYQFEQQEKRNRKTKDIAKRIGLESQAQPQPEKSKMIKRKKLKRMSKPELDTPSSEHEQIEQYVSKQIEVKEKIDSKGKDCPRVKITQQYLNMDRRREEDRGTRGNIYFNQIEKIVRIEKRNEKWMVLVTFLEPFEDSWQERDIIRMLYPYKLLIFYEDLYRKKMQK